MLKHHYIAPLFVFMMLLPIMTDYFSELSLIYYSIVVLVFLSLEFYGAYYINSNFHLNAVCKGRTDEKNVSLTFDDGPVETTNQILDVLKEHQVKATFFCIGNKILANETILKRIDAEGHLIGNHSFNHGFFFDFKRPSGFTKELKDTAAVIKQTTEKNPLYFRPPYGVTTPALARAIKKLNYSIIGWNIRSMDTAIQDKTKVLARIKKRLKPGSIILLHDTIPGNASLLKDLLHLLKNEKYTVVSLETLIQKKAYA